MQDAFLGDFGGSKSSEAKGKLMDSHTLPPDKRVMFNALIHVPDVGPAQAHAIAEEYGSFGNLIANLLDPSACAPCAASMGSRLEVSLPCAVFGHPPCFSKALPSPGACHRRGVRPLWQPDCQPAVPSRDCPCVLQHVRSRCCVGVCAQLHLREALKTSRQLTPWAKAACSA